MSGTGARPPARDMALRDFSATTYAAPEVSETCLRLQDECDADVNLILYCCWLGATGRGPVNARDLADLSQAVAQWQTRVAGGLRGVRRWLSEPPSHLDHAATRALRGAVKSAELEAEWIEQATLATALPRPPVVFEEAHRRRDIASSLNAYFRFIGRAISPEDVDLLASASCGAVT